MSQLQTFACHTAELGTFTCDVADCEIERHPAVRFNTGCECEFAIVFEEWKTLESFARSILFELAAREAKTLP